MALTLTAAEFSERFVRSDANASAEPRCVVVVANGIYDATPFLSRHPGGAAILRRQHGNDVTALFRDRFRHSAAAERLLATLRIGTLVLPASAAIPIPTTAAAAASTVATPTHADASDANGPLIEAEGDPLPDVVLQALRERDANAAWQQRRRHKKAAGNAAALPLSPGATKGAGYAARWHAQRRLDIAREYPDFVRRVIEPHSFYPPTLLFGAAGAAIQWWVAAQWIPALVARLAVAAVAVGADAVAPENERDVAGPSSSPIAFGRLLACGPACAFSNAFVADLSLASRLCMLAIAVFLLAYTVGAVCKMVSFAVCHELCHETVHPFLSVLHFAPTAGEAPRDGSNRQTDGHLSAVQWLRCLAKDVAMRVSALPSLGSVVFEYYHNQHLAHHRHLGALDVADSVRGLLDGTNTGDGDQLSINTLLMIQRTSETQAPLGRPEDGPHVRRGFRSLRFDSIAGRWDPATSRLRRFNDRHPVLVKLVWDPAAHVAHATLMLLTSVMHIVVLHLWALLAVMYVAPFLPWPVYAALRCLFRADAAAAYLARVSRVRVVHSSLRAGMAALWPMASCGVQDALSLLLAVAAARGWFAIGDRAAIAVAAAPLTCAGSVVAFLLLSDMFLFGFLFHPFVIYFLSVHQSHFSPGSVGTTSGSAESGSRVVRRCQPTRSVYAPWLSWFAFNLTHHVEHHDWPSVAWRYLPVITEEASRFYGSETHNAAFHGGWDVLWKYLNDRDTFVYGCATENHSEDDDDDGNDVASTDAGTTLAVHAAH